IRRLFIAPPCSVSARLARYRTSWAAAPTILAVLALPPIDRRLHQLDVAGLRVALALDRDRLIDAPLVVHELQPQVLPQALAQLGRGVGRAERVGGRGHAGGRLVAPRPAREPTPPVNEPAGDTAPRQPGHEPQSEVGHGRPPAAHFGAGGFSASKSFSV